MATINEVARARRAGVRAYRQEVRVVDTLIEKLDRQLKRLLARRKKLIETSDIERIVDLSRAVASNVDSMARGADKLVRTLQF